MTYEEAIKVLTDTRVMILKGSGTDLAEACSMAIEALEKQNLKKPIKQKMKIKDCIDQIRFFEQTVCPSCGESVRCDWKLCFECGQAIDWSE